MRALSVSLVVLWAQGCGEGNTFEPGSLTVCVDSTTVEAAGWEQSHGFGYAGTIIEEPEDPVALDPACGMGRITAVDSYDVVWTFGWGMTGVDDTIDFEVFPGDSVFWMLRTGAVDEGEGLRAGVSLILRQYDHSTQTAGAIIGILKDVDLDPADYAEVEVRHGEVVHQDLQDTDYALVFDGDAFIAVNPGLWARTQITGWDRKVANVYARGDDLAPQHTMWAIWASN